MLIDLKKMRTQGKDFEDFEFSYKPDANLIPYDNAFFDGDVKLSGRVTLTGKDVYASFDVNYKIQGLCSRCLETASEIVETGFDEEFYNTKQDDDVYYYKNDTLDLTKVTDDAILMSMPLKILCKEDCKGLCTSCGANLNIAQCNCKK